MGDYIGTKALSEITGIPQNVLTSWCRAEKIPGAEQDEKGSPWRIPVDAVLPEYKKRKKD